MDFSGLPHIAERIFKFLDLETTLNCRLICSNWKKVLDNPMMWLINCPKKHPLSRKIIKKSLTEICEALDELSVKSKYGLLLMECYFTKCKRLDRSLKVCQPDHSYLIWPLVIAIKKHKDMNMVKKILSFIGNPKCLKIEKEPEKVCCFLRPMKTLIQFGYEQSDIVELMYSLKNIIEVNWNVVLELAVLYGNLKIVKLVFPSCEKSIRNLCNQVCFAGRKRKSAVKMCEIFIKELAKQNLLNEAFEDQHFRNSIKHKMKGPRRKEFMNLFKDFKEMRDQFEFLVPAEASNQELSSSKTTMDCSNEIAQLECYLESVYRNAKRPHH